MDNLYNNQKFLEYLLKNEAENKKILKKLLEKILKKGIENIEFEGLETYKDIIEYNFTLLKVNVIYSTEQNESIYLKIIKGGKIKESIFCYWSILYDEFLKNNDSNLEHVVQKAIITQITSDESTSNLILTLNAKLNYCAEIYLLELKTFLKKIIKSERWLDSLAIKNEDILFIGKKMY